MQTDKGGRFAIRDNWAKLAICVLTMLAILYWVGLGMWLKFAPGTWDDSRFGALFTALAGGITIAGVLVAIVQITLSRALHQESIAEQLRQRGVDHATALLGLVEKVPEGIRRGYSAYARLSQFEDEVTQGRLDEALDEDRERQRLRTDLREVSQHIASAVGAAQLAILKMELDTDDDQIRSALAKLGNALESHLTYAKQLVKEDGGRMANVLKDRVELVAPWRNAVTAFQEAMTSSLASTPMLPEG